MEKNSKNNERQRYELVRALSLLSQIGISMAVCVFIGVFLGKLLDGFFGTAPWLLLLFSFMGMGAAFKALVDLTVKK